MLDLRGKSGMTPVSYDITTFLGSSTRCLKEARLVVAIPGGNKLPITFLADHCFNHNFRVFQLNLAEPGLAKEGDQFDVHGNIGVDVSQFLPEFKMVSCMNGSAWKVPGGLVPFGNILHFFYTGVK